MSLKNNNRLKETCDFGDKRLNSRLAKICNNFSKYLEASIPQNHMERSQMKAGYNFFKNKKISVSKIIAGHRDLHQEHRKTMHHQVLLCAQDKTELDYTNKKSSKKFGPLNHLNQKGCLLQSSLITSEKGVPIGLFKQSNITRTIEGFSKRKNKGGLQPIEAKESFHWINHYKELQEYFRDCKGVEVFCTNDREADIYELFSAKNSDNVHLIVRSRHNRTLDHTDYQDLYGKLKSSETKHVCTIKVTDRRSCKKRKAKVALRYTDATIKLAYPNKWQKNLKPIKLWAIEVKEINPPKAYKPIQWILLTTYPIESVRVALRINKYYVLRWVIERFHYVLKSGAKVKELQLHEPQRVLNAVAAYSISAVNIMRINYLARFYPDISALEAGFNLWQLKVLFAYITTHINKKAAFDKNAPPNIRQTVVYIAQMGGFTNFSNQDFPGLKTFWKGWNNFNLIINTAIAINFKQLSP